MYNDKFYERPLEEKEDLKSVFSVWSKDITYKKIISSS